MNMEYRLLIQDAADSEGRDGGTFAVLRDAIAAGRAHVKTAIRGKAWVEWHDEIVNQQHAGQTQRVDYILGIDQFAENDLRLEM